MATNIRLREVFRLWHSRAKGLTAYTKLREDLKGQMLERLRVLHARFSGDALRYYMNKWKDSCKENRLVKRVVFRMLQTHFGLKYMAFNTWKAKASKKMILKTNAAMQLEQALKHLYRKNLQWGFDPLANEWYRAVDMKVQTVKSLMFISQGSLRRSFKIWATNVENLKHIEACRSVILLMNTINEGFRNHIASWMSVDSVAKVQKEKTVRIIMGNMDNNLLEAFRTWKAFTREKALEEAKVVENTKAMLLKLSLLERRLSRNYVKECFEELKYNVQVHKTKKRVLLGLLKTNFGLLHDYFNRWKNLPKPEDPRKQMGVGTVSFQLIKLYERAIKHGFDALKSVWHEKNEAKRACVRRILYMTQSSQKRLFDHWKAATIFARNAERCRETLNFFEVVKYSLNSNIAAALEPDTKKSFKIKMFNRLKDETTLLLRITLKTWRESVWQMKAEENVQNQRILVSFIRLIKWLEKKRIEAQKEAFGAMLEHKQHLNHAKRIALALYKTRMGQLLSAWQKWKSIPGPDKNALKASSFALAKVLHALCQKTLKDAFENIKEEWIEANEIKKDAVRKMIWLTNGLTKDAFDRWASHARTAKSMKVYGAAQKLFSLSALVLERSLKDMRKGIIMSAPKRASTHKIVKYFIGLNLRPWFQRWYFASKIHKADTKVKIPNLARIIERLRLVALKEVFEMLKTRNSTLKLKRFVAIFRKYDEMHKKEAIESIKQHYYLQKQKKLMFAVNNIIRYNRLFTQSSLYTFFSAWRQWSRDYNPWFKRAINLVSKNSRINTQIAFWRLRDSIKVKGSHLNTAKSEKTNKIFLILKKKYEQTLTRAFWQIETYGKMHNTSLSIPGENLEEVKKSRASGGTQKPISLETSFDSSFLSKSKFEKQKQLILKLLVRNYTLQVQNTRERLKEYFKRWTLHTSKAPKAVFESLNSKMNENELVHLARLGTIEMLKEKLENVVARMKMDAFELLLKHAGKERKKLLNLMESPSDNIHSSPSSNVNASGSISIEKQSPEGKNYTLPEFQPDNLHVGSEKVIPEDTPDFRTQGENSPN